MMRTAVGRIRCATSAWAVGACACAVMMMPRGAFAEPTVAPASAPPRLGAVDAAPGAVDATPGAVDAAPGAVDAAPGAVDATPGAVDATPGAVDAAPGAVDATPGAVDAAGAGEGASVGGVKPPASASDGPVAVTTRVMPAQGSIGDVLTLEVTAAYAKDISVNLPIGIEFAPLHLISIDEGEPESTGQGLRKVFRLTFQAFFVGHGSTPAFSLTYVTAQGNVHTLEVPAHEFDVQSLLANEAQPERKPEDPPVALTYPNTLAEIIIYSVLATLIVALALWWMLRRWLRRRPVAVAPPRPAHEVAFELLDALERKQLPSEQRFQDYYLELTEIAKQYLEQRFAFEALDRTTDELRNALLARRTRILPLDADKLVRFLQEADLVKFARLAPSEAEAAEALTFVRECVRSTIAKDKSTTARGGAPTGDRTPPTGEATTREVA